MRDQERNWISQHQRSAFTKTFRNFALACWIRAIFWATFYVNKYKRGIFELTGTTISVAEIVKNDFSVTKQHGARSFNSVGLDS